MRPPALNGFWLSAVGDARDGGSHAVGCHRWRAALRRVAAMPGTLGELVDACVFLIEVGSVAAAGML